MYQRIDIIQELQLEQFSFSLHTPLYVLITNRSSVFRHIHTLHSLNQVYIQFPLREI